MNPQKCKINKAGLELIKSFEGCELEAYYDRLARPPVWTIGYGHTSRAGPPKVYPGMRITEEEAEEILRNDVNRFARKICKYIKVELNENQFSALVSFAYNVGVGAFRKSTLLKRINAGRFDDVPNQLMRWVRAGGKVRRGLVRRRKAEAQLFMKPVERVVDNDMDVSDEVDFIKEFGTVIKGYTTARLRYRAAPSLKAKILGVFPLGVEISIVDETDNWYKVVTPRGKLAWVYKKYVRVEF